MKQRIQTILEQLNTGLIEREEPIRLALLSALSGEHLLLIGEPGTAKSVLARKLHLAFKDGEYFERLLTKFSVPEELFGPLSIKALENDSYLRLTDRYLPAARSYNAAKPSSLGNSLLAAITETRGTLTRASPLSNSRSFSIVNKALRIALFALKISSIKAILAAGR
jgi:MoxR-like ATPase